MSLLTKPVGPEDHSRGPEEAPVTLVEYGDYECPHCGRAAPIVKAVLKDLSGLVRFVYRHFPLTHAHPHAEQAAEAAEAAGAQGRYWEMHDTLFANQSALSDAHLLRYAAAIGLDETRFAQELAAGIYAPKVAADFQSGMRSGVNGTPTFFINSVRYDGSWANVPAFTAALRAAAATGIA